MTYEVVILKKALKDLKKIPTAISSSILEWASTDLSENPYNAHDGIVKNQLYDEKVVYKKRFGKYRVLFSIFDETVLVVLFKVGHRKDIYDF